MILVRTLQGNYKILEDDKAVELIDLDVAVWRIVEPISAAAVPRLKRLRVNESSRVTKIVTTRADVEDV